MPGWLIPVIIIGVLLSIAFWSAIIYLIYRAIKGGSSYVSRKVELDALQKQVLVDQIRKEEKVNTNDKELISLAKIYVNAKGNKMIQDEIINKLDDKQVSNQEWRNALERVRKKTYKDDHYNNNQINKS